MHDSVVGLNKFSSGEQSDISMTDELLDGVSNSGMTDRTCTKHLQKPTFKQYYFTNKDFYKVVCIGVL